MKLLAIESSTHYASVALSVNQEIISLQQEGFSKHAELLLPMISELLAEADIVIDQLDGLIYGCGPGSFTGLRVACSIAKGLSYAHDIPLIPVSTLATIAFDVFAMDDIAVVGDNIKVVSLIDARMQQLYWAVFSKDLFVAPENLTAPVEIKINPPVLSSQQLDFWLGANERNESLYMKYMTDERVWRNAKNSNAKIINELDKTNKDLQAKIVLAGVGYQKYQQDFPAAIQKLVTQTFDIYPCASTMLKLNAYMDYKSVTVSEALPTYLRAAVS